MQLVIQFFHPESWRFYWEELTGEKQIRYVPNAGHSLEGTDVIQTLTAFHHAMITEAPLPTMDWEVVEDRLEIRTDPAYPPSAVKLWQTTNPEARDFRIDVIGETWTATDIFISENGRYELTVSPPEEGWRAFFAEMTFEMSERAPLKLTTGVVVTPETLAYAPYESPMPQGNPLANCPFP